jgi:hypothetical protein
MDASSQLLKEALSRVHGGERQFSPVGSSSEQLFAFQPIAEALVAASQEGLVRVSSAPRSKGRDRYDMVLSVSVTGPLTPAGAARLRELSMGRAAKIVGWVSGHTREVVIATVATILAALVGMVIGF